MEKFRSLNQRMDTLERSGDTVTLHCPACYWVVQVLEKHAKDTICRECRLANIAMNGSDNPLEILERAKQRAASGDTCVIGGCKLGQWEILPGLALQGRRCIVCNRVAVTCHLPEPT